MRVLLSTDVVGGVWDHAASLAAALVRRGHRVRLAIVGTPTRGQLSRLAPGVTWGAEPVRLEWLPGGLDDVGRAEAWLEAEADAWGADVLHLNQLTLAPAASCPTLLAAHSDVLSWYREVRGSPAAPPEWSRYAVAVRRGLEAAGIVVTPSAYQSRQLRLSYGRGADRVVWNGVEPVAEPRRASRSRPLLLCAGRAWDAAKGVEVLEAALERLGPEAPETRLLGSTEGPRGERFRPRRLRAEGWLGRAAVDRWLDRADVFVAPSLYEPFGLAPLEAALHGCALVLSDIGSFRELWDGCAAFFPKGDAPGLAAALRGLLRDPARMAELGALAGARARERYQAERMAGDYLDSYEVLRRGVHAGRAGGTERTIACA